MNRNFAVALAFVWRPGHDSPADGYHETPGDPGGATFGAVIQLTWANAVRTGIVSGELEHASLAQLSAVLQAKFWQPTCDLLPDGLDLLMFNGRVMTGRFPWLFQQCLGFMEGQLDGWIGPKTLKAVRASEPKTLIAAVSGAHYAYLRGLGDEWTEFGHGWTTRLQAAQTAATALAVLPPVG